MSAAMDSASTSVDSMVDATTASTSCSPMEPTRMVKEVITLDSDEMQVDENEVPPTDKQASTLGIQGKVRAIQGDTDASKTTKRKVLAATGRKSNEKAFSDRPASKKAKLDTFATAPSSSQRTQAVVYSNDLVQLKSGKLTLKQKKIDWARNTAALQLTIDWNQYLEDVEDPLEGIPAEHLPLLILLGVESDKTSPELAKEVRKLLVPDGPADEQSQITNRLPLPILAKSLGSLLERVNHGLRDPSNDDTVNERDLPVGIDKVPAAFKIWRWEIKDGILDNIATKLPEDVCEKLSLRANERLEARAATKALLDAMSAEERMNMLKGGKSSNTATAKATGPRADQSSSKMHKSNSGEGGEEKKKGGRQKKELTEEEEAEAAERERNKAEKAAAAAVKKAENEAKRVELDAKRAVKAQKKAEEEEKQRKKDDLMKKQRNALGGWLAKSGTSPIESMNRFIDSPSSEAVMSDVALVIRGSTPVVPAVADTKSSDGETDFLRAFRPFYVKANTFVAPPNRFTATRTARQSSIMDAAFTSIADSLRAFIELADASRIPSTSRRSDVHSVADLYTAIQEQELVGNMTERSRLLAVLSNPDKVPMKLLKFVADVRPGYQGSWTKQSKIVSARRPFAQDITVLDYEYDSEGEWEEDPEDVEDVCDEGSAAGDDVSSENEYEVDDWLADDDEQIEMAEGYEGASSLLNPDHLDSADTGSPFASAINAAKKTIKSAVRKKKVTPLIAIIKGPYWADEQSEKANDLARYFDSFKIQLLGPAAKYGFVDPRVFAEKPTKTSDGRSAVGHPQSSNGMSSISASGEKKELTIRKKMVPTDLMPTFEKMVRASEATSKEKLRDEVLAAFNGNKNVNKSVIERQIAESCNKRKAKEVGADGAARWWEIKTPTAST